MRPHQVRSLLRGSVPAILAVALLDGGVAWSAQRAGIQALAAADAGPPWTYPLGRHVLAMVLLAVLTVAVSSGLRRAGFQVLGFAVLVGVVAGPMTVIAAPVRGSLITAGDGDTRLWWHLLVGGAQLTILLAADGWVTRCRRVEGAVSGSPDRPPLLVRSGWSVFGVFAATAVTVQVVAMPNPGTSEHPGLAAILGWAALGAGLAVLVARSSRNSAPAWSLLAAGIVLGALAVAYVRPGGWPGVAGWEFMGMQPPVILSPAAELVLLAGPLLGLLVQARRITARIGRRYSPEVRLSGAA
jgi:hypothetical protein